ncbi:unnamed protein product [Mesocestoides corti]|uniref:Transmembrane protein 131-like N-terminal domain-containing protein n=1 Tax=Mesocestoides corti TaxID=53468 RepID=A0A158QRZ2_MESCO|nr:unnamed protein product [Mesocestoides corti]
MPAYANVTITNTSPNHPVEIASFQTSSFALLFTSANTLLLEPEQSKNITLLLVADELGHIEAELYATTSTGQAKCKVYGFSTSSIYGLRPITAKLSVAKIHDLVFTFSNPYPFHLKVSEMVFHGSSFMQTDRNRSLFSSVSSNCRRQQNAYHLQVPDSFTTAGQQRSGSSSLFHIEEKVLDFGTIRVSDPAKRLHLTVCNQLTVPLNVHVKTVNADSHIEIVHDSIVFPDSEHYGKKFATITFNPAVLGRIGYFSGKISVEADGQSPILIPYKASVHNGSLLFSHQQLSFYCGISTEAVELNSLRSGTVTITNAFEFPLEIQGYRLPDEYANLFEIGGLAKAEYLLPAASANITIHFKGFHQERHICDVASLNLTFYTNASSFSISLNLYNAKLKVTSPMADEFEDTLSFGVFEIDTHYTLDFYIYNPNPIPSTVKLLEFRASLGSLTLKPAVFHLGSAFPGASILRNLLVHNSYDSVVDLSTVFLFSNRGFPKFHVDLAYQHEVLSNGSNGRKALSLEPRQTTLIGSVSINTSFGCSDVFTENPPPDIPICYSGFELGSSKGGHWFATIFFPFSRDDGVLHVGSVPAPLSGIPFVPGLRFSADIFARLRTAWHSLTERIHGATVGTPQLLSKPTEQCRMSSKLALHASVEEAPFFGQLTVQLTWPRLLAPSASPRVFKPLKTKEAPLHTCQLEFNLGQSGGLAQLRIQDFATKEVTCLLTFRNPSERPLFIQALLLDDLLPASMDYNEMIRQMPLLSEELFRAAQLPDELLRIPHNELAASLYMWMGTLLAKIPWRLYALFFMTMASSMLFFLLAVLFMPGAFHNGSANSTSNDIFTFDHSILLLRNNLTSLEAVLLRAVADTSILELHSGLLSTESFSQSTRVEQTLVNFPTATGSAHDAAANFNPSLSNPTCKSASLAGSVDIARYNLRPVSNELLCSTTVSNGANLSLCRVSMMPRNKTSPYGATLPFVFHEGLLRSLCADGSIRAHPSIARLLKNFKLSSLFNLRYSATPVDVSRRVAPHQLSWAVDENGVPIFSSEFISGLVLSRCIALRNSGSLPVWVLRVGLKRPGSVVQSSSKSAWGQCNLHLDGFTVNLSAISTDSMNLKQHKTGGKAFQVFQLKPGEQRWFEVTYSPDFLRTEANVELCLFASLQMPSTDLTVCNSKPTPRLESSVHNSMGRDTDTNRCSVFQLDPVLLTAKVSPSLAKLCHSSLIQPPFQDNLWSILLFVFTSNIVGIFVAAYFDAIRLQSLQENFRQPTPQHLNLDPDQRPPSQLFSFSLPPRQDRQQLSLGCLSSYFPLLVTNHQPLSMAAADDAICRHRFRRPSTFLLGDQCHSGNSAGIAVRCITKPIVRLFQTALNSLGKAIYWPLVLNLSLLGNRLSNTFFAIKRRIISVGQTNKVSTQRVPKTFVDTSSSTQNFLSQIRHVDSADKSSGVSISRKCVDDTKRLREFVGAARCWRLRETTECCIKFQDTIRQIKHNRIDADITDPHSVSPTGPHYGKHQGGVCFQSSKQKSPSLFTADSAAKLRKASRKIAASNPLNTPGTPVVARQTRKSSLAGPHSPDQWKDPIPGLFFGNVNTEGEGGHHRTEVSPWTPVIKPETSSSPAAEYFGDADFPPLGSSVDRLSQKGSYFDDEMSRLVAETSKFDQKVGSSPSVVLASCDKHFSTETDCQETARMAICSGYCNSSVAPTYDPRHSFLRIPLSTLVAYHRPNLYYTASHMELFCPLCCRPSYASASPPTRCYYDHTYEPIGLQSGGARSYYVDEREHHRRSTGQIFVSEENLSTMADSCVGVDGQDPADTPRWSNEENYGEDLRPPGWPNAFGVSLEAPSVCELETFTTTRRQWMLMHEQRARMRPKTNLNFGNELMTLDCKYLVPSAVVSHLSSFDGQGDELVSLKERGEVTFDKTVGSQLAESKSAIGITGAAKVPDGQNKPSEPLPEGFEAFSQKAWLPAFLPWRKRCLTEDPARASDHVGETLRPFPPTYQPECVMTHAFQSEPMGGGEITEPASHTASYNEGPRPRAQCLLTEVDTNQLIHFHDEDSLK